MPSAEAFRGKELDMLSQGGAGARAGEEVPELLRVRACDSDREC